MQTAITTDNLDRSRLAPSEPNKESIVVGRGRRSAAHRNSRRASVASSILADAAAAAAAESDQSPGAGRRLVEYFVVVSSIPRKKSGGHVSDQRQEKVRPCKKEVVLKGPVTKSKVEPMVAADTQDMNRSGPRNSCPATLLAKDVASFRGPISPSENTNNDRRDLAKHLRRIKSRWVHLMSPRDGSDDIISKSRPLLSKAKSCHASVGQCPTVHIPVIGAMSAEGKSTKKQDDNDPSEKLMPALARRCSQPHQPKWLREGGAAKNIHVPGENDDTKAHGGIEFEPRVTARFPAEDYPNSPLNLLGITQFCNPTGEAPVLTSTRRDPHVHYFVLTMEDGKRVYGTCLTVYEEFHEPEAEGLSFSLSKDDMEDMLWQRDHAGEKMTCDLDNSCPHFEVEMQPERKAKLYLPRMLCLLSTQPYLTAFREYLATLYHLTTSTELPIPLERYILNISQEIPAPSPGSFAVRVSFDHTTIHFYAPPANQPVSYVSLPFDTLFKCLDQNNILFVWYCLVLERKVLLVSSCGSLLTVCAEILCSLLFPLRWSHIFIPMVPRFLTPMLDAPMPYLCGISRENFEYAVGDVSDDAIVVDLDQNCITIGSNTPELPPLPQNRLGKLEAAVEAYSRQVFWSARGLGKEEIAALSLGALDDVQKMTEQTWDDWLSRVDVADSDKPWQPKTNSDTHCEKQVQDAFLQFFTALLQEYRGFLTMPKEAKRERDTPPTETHTTSSDGAGIPSFDEDMFVTSQRQEYQPFLQELIYTQHFDDFCTRCMYSPDEPDLLFFNEVIDEKVNRSLFTLNKIATPLLENIKSQKPPKALNAVKPNEEDISDEKKFKYASWPPTFDPGLFGEPRFPSR